MTYITAECFLENFAHKYNPITKLYSVIDNEFCDFLQYYGWKILIIDWYL